MCKNKISFLLLGLDDYHRIWHKSTFHSVLLLRLILSYLIGMAIWKACMMYGHVLLDVNDIRTFICMRSVSGVNLTYVADICISTPCMRRLIIGMNRWWRHHHYFTRLIILTMIGMSFHWRRPSVWTEPSALPPNHPPVISLLFNRVSCHPWPLHPSFSIYKSCCIYIQ